MSRRLQPEPTCTWHKQSQSGMKSPLVLLSITTQCNERLHNTYESGSIDFRFLLNQNKSKLPVHGQGEPLQQLKLKKADVKNQAKHDSS